MFKGLSEFYSSLGFFPKILLAILIIWGLWELIEYFRRKNAATLLSKEEFKKDIRRAQLIDVRENDEFKAEHILGARNIPYTEIKQRYIELRNDQPIYLYDSTQYFSSKAAIFLKKQGFIDIYILEGGYENWDGRIKRSKLYRGV